MKFGLLSGWDEFNYLNFVNYLDLKATFPNDEFYVDATPSTDILFPNLDKIVIPSEEYFNTRFITSPQSAVNTNRFSINDIKRKIREWYENNGIMMFDDANLDQEYFDHKDILIYSFMFRTTAKRMQEDSLKWVLPKRRDYFLVKEKLSHINSPIVVIVGRNLDKSTTRNYLLVSHIEEMLRLGAFVINTTIHPPGLRYDNYIEVGGNTFTYSEQVSYFLNANVVLALGNGAGISVHLTTPTNIVAFSVNEDYTIKSNQEIYQHRGMDLVESRKTIKSVETEFTSYMDFSNFKKYLDFKKPIINDFFDESKLIRIDL